MRYTLSAQVYAKSYVARALCGTKCSSFLVTSTWMLPYMTAPTLFAPSIAVALHFPCCRLILPVPFSHKVHQVVGRTERHARHAMLRPAHQ